MCVATKLINCSYFSFKKKSIIWLHVCLISLLDLFQLSVKDMTKLTNCSYKLFVPDFIMHPKDTFTGCLAKICLS